jgi:ketosteroid isomerase-like protein
VDDRTAIQRTLNAWAAAYASRDVSRFANIATFSASQTRSLQSAFEQQSSHNVTLSGCQVQNANATTGRATCHVARVITFKDGKGTSNDSNVTFELTKRGDGSWIVTSQR